MKLSTIFYNSDTKKCIYTLYTYFNSIDFLLFMQLCNFQRFAIFSYGYKCMKILILRWKCSHRIHLFVTFRRFLIFLQLFKIENSRETFACVLIINGLCFFGLFFVFNIMVLNIFLIPCDKFFLDNGTRLVLR